ncbi:methionyl-tRNA formyltransferase [Thermoanaerobacteraceae bacterium SP2]|jgi:methionyl-tRNA formyltransferase|nr:methionyl-tRNA formyltransferase [Thermoanaerobacteraceae bacterium]RKL63160.1 methionyl-tRNA formyltransferase [Thermoanaerobacteraceae bacterium SP2]
MNVIFMGTPEFAVPSLKTLLDTVNVQAVVTQPDRPVGRKRIITPPPVKKIAVENGLQVFQPEKVRDEQFIKVLSSFKPDLIVVAAFGQILPRQVLKVPSIGCINVHASLLPKYRGAAPIQWSIINGEHVTGITIMWMDEGLDTGDIFLQEQLEIKKEWTYEDLAREMSLLGGKVLKKSIEMIKSGNLIHVPQDPEKATYAPMLKKEHGRIDWNKSAVDIYNLIRGLYPWPGAYTLRNGQEIKIWEAEAIPQERKVSPGKFYGTVRGKGFLIGCTEGCLLVKELQEAGRKRMTAMEYMAGHPMSEGDNFADD